MNSTSSSMQRQQRQSNNKLDHSTIIKSKWRITSKIGQGAFGETYSAVDIYTNAIVAIKVERLDNKKMVLKLEVIALKKLQPCPFVVRYVHSGRQDDYNFLVMEQLGENLAELKKKCPNQNFSLSTSLRLGIQMIEALQGVHKLGYIHRDVKPSNFVMGREEKKDRAYLIDFGLARKFRLPNGELRPPRKTAGFRGTARYASLNSHKMKELGRRDDIWSVFYVLVEFCAGSLPWRKIKEKETIGQLKEKLTNAELVADLPRQFVSFMNYLHNLGYSDEPDYDYLKNLLREIMEENNYSYHDEWDWMMKEQPHSPPTREMQSILEEGAISSNPSARRDTTRVVTNPISNPAQKHNVNDTDDFCNVYVTRKSSDDFKNVNLLQGKKYTIDLKDNLQDRSIHGCKCVVM